MLCAFCRSNPADDRPAPPMDLLLLRLAFLNLAGGREGALAAFQSISKLAAAPPGTRLN
jgi:hypothetical protein